MEPVCEIEKQLYLEAPARNVAAHASRKYVGRGTRMVERRSFQSTSDWGEDVKQRFSEDNGETWTDWEVVFKEHPRQGEYRISQSDQRDVFDADAGVSVTTVFQRIVNGDPKVHGLFDDGKKRFWDHAFYRLSFDDARTWTEPRLLKFEPGNDFDGERWADPEYLENNEAYVNGISVLPSGGVMVTATVAVPYRDSEDEHVPVAFPSGTREGCVGGVLCFLGTWDPDSKDYDWRVSEPLFVPRKVSTRGLFETTAAPLRNGNLLLVMRGSNAGVDPLITPGRKWTAVSEDGGESWSAVRDLRYDTDEQFYSPSSMPALIRSSKTGKLYFVGNISETPPEGNHPRYPLVIAEVDETLCALKKPTVTVIDDRDPSKDGPMTGIWGRPFENRVTHDFELFATRHWTHTNPDERWTANTYRYIMRF